MPPDRSPRTDLGILRDWGVLRALTEAFDYAQGYDIPGWPAHLTKQETHLRFRAALKGVVAIQEAVDRLVEAVDEELLAYVEAGGDPHPQVDVERIRGAISAFKETA